MDERVPVGQRLRRFGMLLGVVFALTAAVVVTQRLSEDALALLVGLSCGVAAMVPTIGLGVLMWRREQSQRAAMAEAQRTSAQQQQTPPVVVVTPQALPGYGMQRPGHGQDAQGAWPWAAPSSERQFTIVGEEE